MRNNGLGLQLSARPEMQCFGRLNLTNIYQNQVYDQIHEICGKIATLDYIQGISSLRYNMKS